MANIAELDIESIEMSAMSLSKTPRITLRSKFERCPVCLVGQMVEVKREKSEMLIYGRNGVRLAEHKEHRCSNQNTIQPSRVGAFYGYITIEGDKIYDTDYLKNDFLVTSNFQDCFRDQLPDRAGGRHLPLAGLLSINCKEVQPLEQSAPAFCHTGEKDGNIQKNIDIVILSVCLS